MKERVTEWEKIHKIDKSQLSRICEKVRKKHLKNFNKKGSVNDNQLGKRSSISLVLREAQVNTSGIPLGHRKTWGTMSGDTGRGPG